MDSTADRVDLIRSESDRLTRYLVTVTPDEWCHPSACDAWEARDVVAHLIMAADMFKENVARGVRGDWSAPEGLPPAGESNMAARMVANGQRAVALRQRLAEKLLPSFRARCDDLNELLVGLGFQDWNKSCYHPAAIIPVRTFIDLRIAELAIHEWDIRSKVEESTHLSADCLPAILDLIQEFIVGRLFQPGSGLSKPVCYRFELSGSVPGTYDILMGEGEARMEPAGTAAAEVTFHCDAETFALLAYERIALDAAISDGLIAVEGDQELAANF